MIDGTIEMAITKAANGYVIRCYPYTDESKSECVIASSTAELRLQVLKLMEKLYPDPIYADDFVKKEAK